MHEDQIIDMKKYQVPIIAIITTVFLHIEVYLTERCYKSVFYQDYCLTYVPYVFQPRSTGCLLLL